MDAIATCRGHPRSSDSTRATDPRPRSGIAASNSARVGGLSSRAAAGGATSARQRTTPRRMDVRRQHSRDIHGGLRGVDPLRPDPLRCRVRLADRLRRVTTQARFLRRSGLLSALGPTGWREMVRAAPRQPGPDGLYRIHAANSPDKVAVVDGSRRFTYAQMDRLIDRLATGLAARGVGRGTAGALALENRMEMLVAQAALQRVGAAAVS